nr:reverse transcriptase domain-containing protein [Tanacetum cinerariifolium]
MYVDGGSLMEILYEHCFNRLRPEIKSQMVPATTSLTGFSGETIWPLGQLRLVVIIGDANHSIRAWMNFMIVRSLSPYNGIIGRPRIRAIQAVPSTVHRMLKFPVKGGIVRIHSTILIPTECTSVITSSTVSKEERTRLANFKVALHPNFPDQEVAIKGMLSDKGRTELCSILKKNLYIFTWKPSDMTGVPRSVVEHRLNIREGYSPVQQKNRGQAPERTKAIQAEVQKLMEAGIMREVYYHDWLSNLVMVKKHDGSWRMCVDFLDLHKALYVDDLDVKSYTEAEMIRDIEETFCTLRKVNMKLNPKKCAFGLAEGMFLGYVVTLEGIKLCLDKTVAVLQQPSLRTIKEVQSLNGKLANLNRFLSKSAEKSLPLFKTLKKCIKKSDFHWTAEAKQAFKQLKQHLSELPLLVTTKPKEELIIYLSATYETISAVLMTERGMIMHRDARDMIRKCNDCQIHRLITRSPQQPLTPITALWPFYKWEIDIAGPFPEGPDKVNFLIVSMDYFTKWIEAKAVATITGGQSYPQRSKCLRTIPQQLTWPGDFVYRSNDAGHAVAGRKLGPKCEGPYEVTEALGDEAYKLRSMDETILLRTWNIANLK